MLLKIGDPWKLYLTSFSHRHLICAVLGSKCWSITIETLASKTKPGPSFQLYVYMHDVYVVLLLVTKPAQLRV